MNSGSPSFFPSNSSASESRRISQLLRQESTGGILLVVAAALGLIAANSGLSPFYTDLRDAQWGIPALHLELTTGQWVADGLLAVFFFLIGLELKREFVAGDLRQPRTALVPIVAALGGVIVPAVLFLAVAGADPLTRSGWAIPVATDIAFALAVLAIIGSHLPSALRVFLLTLAVVDDLIGIVLIAILSAKDVQWWALAAAIIPLALYAFLTHRWRERFVRHASLTWLALLPLGIVTWYFVHEAGIHATIAGVALGLAVPVLGRTGTPDDGLASSLEHHLRPLSAGVIVPVFAFFAAGVSVGGDLGELTASPVFVAIVIALVVGKPLGIVSTTWLLTRTRFAQLDPSYRWVDLWGLGALAGIGFTVSLLIASISFDGTSLEARSSTLAVLIASIVAAVLAAAILAPRNRRYRALGLETLE